jgi:hypothetical protein
MADLSVGPFKIEAELADLGVRVKASIDFKVLRKDWEVVLSAHSPHVSFSTGSVADFEASLDIAIDDTTGRLTASARLCVPVYHPPFSVRKECTGASGGITVLPAGALCLLAQGIGKAGLQYLDAHFAKRMPSCEDLRRFRAHASPAFIDSVKQLSRIAAHGQTLPAAVLGELGHLPAATVHVLNGLGQDRWAQIIQAVVSDPRVGEIYPGIRAKFGPDLPGEKLETLPPRQNRAGAAALEGVSAGTVILSIVGGLAVAAGLSVATVAAIAAVVGAIVAVVASTAVTGGVAFVLVAILVIGLCLLLAIGIMVIPVLAILGLIGALMVNLTEAPEQAAPEHALLTG